MEVVGWIGRNGDRGEWKKEEEGMRERKERMEEDGWMDREMVGWIEGWDGAGEMVGWRASLVG